MTILLAVATLATALALAHLASDGLPGTMRRLGLWLIVCARRIETRRAMRDARVRQGLVAEGGAL